MFTQFHPNLPQIEAIWVKQMKEIVHMMTCMDSVCWTSLRTLEIGGAELYLDSKGHPTVFSTTSVFKISLKSEI